MSRKSRDKEPNGGQSVFQVKHIAIAVGISLVVFLLFKVRSSQMSQSAEPLIEKPLGNEPIIFENSVSENFDKQAYGRELIDIRKKAHATRSLGIKSLVLTKSKGKIRIPFEFVPQKLWCQGGDIDTIRYATSKTNAKEVLITLESLGNSKVKESLKVSVDNLIAGFTHTFAVDAGIKDSSLSLSICTDRKKTGSCKKASVVDQAALNNALGAASNRTTKDFLFYFQHLLYSGGKLQTYSNDNFTADYRKRLNSFLNKSDVDKDEIERAWQLNKKIRSNPVNIVNGKIVLSLPYNDPRCMPGN